MFKAWRISAARSTAKSVVRIPAGGATSASGNSRGVQRFRLTTRFKPWSDAAHPYRVLAVSKLPARVRAGPGHLLLGRIMTAEHPIEVVGAKLREMMPWIRKNKLVDQSRN